jgi:hypothetical protein
MKITALVFAVPLMLGAGFASAETTTTTEKTVDTPVGSVQTRTTTDHGPSMGGATVEKHKSTTENPDGSVTTQRSTTVNRPD